MSDDTFWHEKSPSIYIYIYMFGESDDQFSLLFLEFLIYRAAHLVAGHATRTENVCRWGSDVPSYSWLAQAVEDDVLN